MELFQKKEKVRQGFIFVVDYGGRESAGELAAAISKPGQAAETVKLYVPDMLAANGDNIEVVWPSQWEMGVLDDKEEAKVTNARLYKGVQRYLDTHFPWHENPSAMPTVTFAPYKAMIVIFWVDC